MTALDRATAPSIATLTVDRDSAGLVAAALRIAADASRKRPSNPHDRTLVKRSLIDELRTELDAIGLGDDWRTLHKLIRVEERIT